MSAVDYETHQADPTFVYRYMMQGARDSGASEQSEMQVFMSKIERVVQNRPGEASMIQEFLCGSECVSYRCHQCLLVDDLRRCCKQPYCCQLTEMIQRVRIMATRSRRDKQIKKKRVKYQKAIPVQCFPWSKCDHLAFGQRSFHAEEWLNLVANLSPLDAWSLFMIQLCRDGDGGYDRAVKRYSTILRLIPVFDKNSRMASHGPIQLDDAARKNYNIAHSELAIDETYLVLDEKDMFWFCFLVGTREAVCFLSLFNKSILMAKSNVAASKHCRDDTEYGAAIITELVNLVRPELAFLEQVNSDHVTQCRAEELGIEPPMLDLVDVAWNTAHRGYKDQQEYEDERQFLHSLRTSTKRSTRKSLPPDQLERLKQYTKKQFIK